MAIQEQIIQTAAALYVPDTEDKMELLPFILILLVIPLGGYLFWTAFSDALDGLLIPTDLVVGLVLLAGAGMALSRLLS